MRLPYMRFAVYALTFLTYAYSGYGSSVIATLRDAIIAAEAVFGDVFQNLIYVAKKFKVVHDVFDAAVEENCFYKCPGGGMPSRNKYYVPSADGCGSLGLKINTEYLPATEMASCCNEHDICYDTCNKDKELCDLDFKRCLYNYCDTYEKTAVGGDLVVKGCKGAAKMLFTGTITLGCKSYLDAQARSCYCPPAHQGQGSSAKGDDTKRNNKRYKENSNARPSAPQDKQKPPSYGWKDPSDM